MKTIPLLCLAACALPLSSCNTTGDPMEGGLFGWSESKFDQRIQQKENTLRGIKNDTARQNYKADGLRSDIYRERRRLNSY